MSNYTNDKNIISVIISATLLWLVMFVSILLLTWTWPITAKGWIAALVIGPVIYVIFEILSALFKYALLQVPLIEKMHKKYTDQNSGKSVSMGRMSYLFLLLTTTVILFVSISFVLQKYAGGVLEPISMFLKINYK